MSYRLEEDGFAGFLKAVGGIVLILFFLLVVVFIVNEHEKSKTQSTIEEPYTAPRLNLPLGDIPSDDYLKFDDDGGTPSGE